MPGIDPDLPFHPLRIAVLTVSDTRDENAYISGALLADRVAAAAHELAPRIIVKDDVDSIREQVMAWVADEGGDLVLATGGNGFAPRDFTPEAVRPLSRREMDGFPVVFHQPSVGAVGLSTLQSRACAGQTEDTLVFCLPGSTGACPDASSPVLGFELGSRYRHRSLAGQIPRLRHLCA